MNKPMSKAPPVIWVDDEEFDIEDNGVGDMTEYVRKDIYDAAMKAVDAWDKWLDGSLDGHDVACLVKAARKAGESLTEQGE